MCVRVCVRVRACVCVRVCVCVQRMQHPAFLAWVEKACQLPLLPDIIRLIAWELTPLEASLALDAQVIWCNFLI